MGETAADTRREIEETRSQLDGTIQVLRARAGGVRAKAVRGLAIAGGAVAVAGAAGAAVLVAKRRRGGSISKAARRFPRPARPPAVSAARGFERWLAVRSKRLERQRTELMDSFAKRLADNQAQAQRRANPLWRRTAARALETAATVGVTEVVRKVAVERGTRHAEPDPQ
ncbi:MAG TPA: hypothetical protein VF155_10080 [Candidatus Dormibacteraeota bacterium]